MQVWSCIVCSTGRGSNLKPPNAPRSQRSTQRSRQSSRNSGGTSSSKAKAVLDAFDEETKLLEKQAKEKEDLLKAKHEQQLDLVRRKQNALNQASSSISGSSKASSRGGSMKAAEKVESWIQSQSNVNHPVAGSTLLKPPGPIEAGPHRFQHLYPTINS